MLQSNWSSLQRYACDHTCTPINLVLEHWVCLSFECYCLKEAELFDLVGGCASIQLSSSMYSFDLYILILLEFCPLLPGLPHSEVID